MCCACYLLDMNRLHKHITDVVTNYGHGETPRLPPPCLRAVPRCYHRPRISRPVRPALFFRALPVVAVVEREIIGKEEE